MTENPAKQSSTPELISVVVPVFNEEGNIGPLYEAVRAEFDNLWYDFELILVDDGSTDTSLEVARKIAGRDARVRVVSFSRNFGTQSAIVAGLEHVIGAAAVVMDADLQHPPSLIPTMIARWKEGFDVVFAVRKDTEGVSRFKRWTSSLFSKVFNVLVSCPVDPNASDYRLLDRQVVDCVNGMRERKRFFRSLIAWTGFRQIGIPFVAAQRHSGETKYSVRKLFSLAADAVTSFSTVPLRFSAYLGIVAAVSGLPYALWAVYATLFTDYTGPGWSSRIVAILVLGGVQLISLGILGEYVGRIYEEVKGRPLYITRERIGFDRPTESRQEQRFPSEIPEFAEEPEVQSVSPQP